MVRLVIISFRLPEDRLPKLDLTGWKSVIRRFVETSAGTHHAGWSVTFVVIEVVRLVRSATTWKEPGQESLRRPVPGRTVIRVERRNRTYRAASSLRAAASKGRSISDWAKRLASALHPRE